MSEPHILTLDEWKALEAAGQAPDDAGLRKSFICEVGDDWADPDEKDFRLGPRDIPITISTASPDRDRDIISAEGWRLTAYRKNPVVLWAHDYRSTPIARAKRLLAGDGKLRALDEFVPADIDPFAETVFQLLKRKFLSAASVGFKPLKYARNDERGGYDFSEQELLEHSIVPVPANAEALVEARSVKGLDLAPLRRWCERFLDEWNGESGLWVPRASAERALEVLSNERVVAVVAGLRGTIYAGAPGASPDLTAPDLPGEDDAKGAPTLPLADLVALLEGQGIAEPAGLEAEVGEVVSKPGIDETENEFRYRLRDPSRFEAGSFRTIPIQRKKPRVNAVAGRLKGETTLTLQALRFPKADDWTADKVRSWLDAHPDVKAVEGEGAEPALEPEMVVLVLEAAEEEDDLVLVLDDGQPEPEYVGEFDPEEISALVGEVVSAALGRRLTAITGRLD